jgi:hypothetical protein
MLRGPEPVEGAGDEGLRDETIGIRHLAIGNRQ